MSWVAVAVGAGAALSAGAAYAGSKKQAKASEKAAGLNMDMFNTVNQQQQPYIQSGYGALSRLNTLMGLSPRPQGSGMPVMSTPMTAPNSGSYGPIEQYVARAIAARQGGGGNAYMPTPGGGVQPIMTNGSQRMYAGGPGGDPYMGGNMQLNRILALRAAHGDTQAASVLNRMQQ
jgi:hypothetical protein